MVQILPRARATFGEQVAGGLEKGAQQGIEFGKMFAEHGLQQQAKRAEYDKKLAGLEEIKKTPYWQGASDLEKAVLEREILGDISAQSSKSLINLQRENIANQKISDLLSGVDEGSVPGRDQFTTEAMQSPGSPEARIGQSKLERIPEAKLRAMLADKTLAPIAQSELNRRNSAQEKTSRVAAINEPELLKLNNRLGSLEQTGMQYQRLQELFSPDLESKFPPSSMVALFTKEGDLKPLAFSQLSDEAQEAVKIINDQLTGAKDTFGARLTNFDVSQYLKRLPSLLNSPKGRRQVLRDLQIINHLNASHDRGVLDIMDRYGNEIPLSQAERRYREENGDYIKDMQDLYIHPDKQDFKSLPPTFLMPIGTTIEDEETGQVFINNGSDWILK